MKPDIPWKWFLLLVFIQFFIHSPHHFQCQPHTIFILFRVFIFCVSFPPFLNSLRYLLESLSLGPEKSLLLAHRCELFLTSHLMWLWSLKVGLRRTFIDCYLRALSLSPTWNSSFFIHSQDPILLPQTPLGIKTGTCRAGVPPPSLISLSLLFIL